MSSRRLPVRLLWPRRVRLAPFQEAGQVPWLWYLFPRRLDRTRCNQLYSARGHRLSGRAPCRLFGSPWRTVKRIGLLCCQFCLQRYSHRRKRSPRLSSIRDRLLAPQESGGLSPSLESHCAQRRTRCRARPHP